jgi:hypothetical protein
LRLELRGPALPLSNVHHEDERGCWATRGRRILRAASPDGPWHEIARFPRRGKRDALGGPRALARALRTEKCTVYPTRRGALLGIRGGEVFRIEASNMVPIFRVSGNCIMNRAIAETPDGEIFFGEYFMNPRGEPIRVWRVDPDLRGGEVAYRFDSPRLRHVHSIHVDPHREGRLWVTTGDFAGQCWVGRTDDRFRSLELLGDGGQSWRAVGLIFHPDRISWLTDTELEPNRVVSLDRTSETISLHGSRPAASWYTVPLSDGGYLGTTVVEPGPSVQTRDCHLLYSSDGIEWSEAGTFRKDWLPMPWFGSGSLSLPSGRYSSAGFWLSGEAVAGLEGVTRRAALVAAP